MYTLLSIVLNFFAGTAKPADEAYLAESTDLPDLERRQRALDDRGRDPSAGIVLGLYAC